MVANLAKMLARLTRQDGELAFTCGLLHNIGDTLLFLAHTEQMTDIEALTAAGGDKAALQQNVFGCNYTDVGAELARRWNFPDELCEAIANQNQPEKTRSAAIYALLLNLAVKMNQRIALGQKPAQVLAEIPQAKLADLKIDSVKLLDQLTRLTEQEDDIETFIS